MVVSASATAAWGAGVGAADVAAGDARVGDTTGAPVSAEAVGEAGAKSGVAGEEVVDNGHIVIYTVIAAPHDYEKAGKAGRISYAYHTEA